MRFPPSENQLIREGRQTWVYRRKGLLANLAPPLILGQKEAAMTAKLIYRRTKPPARPTSTHRNFKAERRSEERACQVDIDRIQAIQSISIDKCTNANRIFCLTFKCT